MSLHWIRLEILFNSHYKRVGNLSNPIWVQLQGCRFECLDCLSDIWPCSGWRTDPVVPPPAAAADSTAWLMVRPAVNLFLSSYTGSLTSVNSNWDLLVDPFASNRSHNFLGKCLGRFKTVTALGTFFCTNLKTELNYWVNFRFFVRQFSSHYVHTFLI